jgi:carbamoyltransferase
MTKFILGIQSFANHDSGACVIKFGNKTKPELIAISEERLLRKKYPYTFPIHSILYCMKYFKIKKLSEIDLIVSDWIRIKRWLRSGPSYNYQKFDYIKEKLNFDKKKIYQIDHHLAHAASAYYPSNYKSSAILIVDGNGSDVETNSYFLGKGNKIKLLENYKCHGIGAAYGAVTKEILNLGTGGEGKTMGLAPYGRSNKNIKIPYVMNGVKTNFSKFMLRMPFSDVMNQLHSNYRPNVIRQKVVKSNYHNVTNKYYSDWAYKIQKISEEVMIGLGKDLYKKTKEKNICLAGGVALNSVANEKLFQKNNFKDIFIFPACSDAGIPYGLAVWAYHNLYGNKKRIPFKNAYTGITYKKNDIVKILVKFKIDFKEISNKKIAELLSKGKIIGNFHGASEYGPRALGNRSILADPRKKNIRNYINKFVKHREMFRPFAPAILEEKSLEYFKVNKSPFMLRVTTCKKKKSIPSSLHVDNTARVQTVNKNENEKFYSIINEFNKITGVPVLLNTSFNDAGEPLVETPLDGIISSLKTNLDFLVLEDYVISLKKLKQNKKKLLNKLIKTRKLQIKRDEKLALEKITKKYSNIELKRKIKKNNKLAKENCLIQPIKRISNFLDSFNKNDPLTIIGSNDHTNILVKLFEKKLKKIQNINFYQINTNDIYKKKKKINFFNTIKFVKKNKKMKYLISTFQYMDEIEHKLKNNVFFNPYDNGSRSIIDYYYIKKFNAKNKIFSKEIY